MTAPQLAAAPLLVALATAILTLLTRTSDRFQRGVSVLGSAAYLLSTLALANVVFGGETLVYHVSDWTAPYGIVLVADPLSAFMLVLAGVVSFLALVYSVSYVTDFGQRLSYHTLFHFMLVGVSGAFLTGDVFNLFVWFEVMLMSSYILVLFYSGPEHTRAALTYVVLNLLGSAVMLVAIGGLYATTGTLNMADLARRIANPAMYNVEILPVLGLSAVLFAVFALKAGLVPFHFWVPAAYRAAPSPVTAVLAGVVKKVGVYAVIRLYFTVFAAASAGSFSLPGLAPASGGAFLGYFGPVLFLMGSASILFGGYVAAGRERIDTMLAFSSIGQVGFIVLPLAVGATVPSVRVLGVTAALVYAFNHGLAKATLFMASGTVQEVVGTDRFDRLGGLARRMPVLAAAFFLGGLALVGVPPLTGFFGKFLVFRTVAEAWAVGAAGTGIALAVVLVGAVLTIAYVTRAWVLAFWGEAGDAVTAAELAAGAPTDGDSANTAADGGTLPDDESVEGSLSPPALQVAAIAALALGLVGFGVGFEAVLSAAQMAAHAATDTAAYVDAVAPADPSTAGEAAHGALLLVLAGAGLGGERE